MILAVCSAFPSAVLAVRGIEVTLLNGFVMGARHALDGGSSPARALCSIDSQHAPELARRRCRNERQPLQVCTQRAVRVRHRWLPRRLRVCGMGR